MRRPPPGTMFARGFAWDRVTFPPRRVSDFATLRYGKRLVESSRLPGSIPVYGTNGPCGWHDRPLAEPPGIVLGRKGEGHLAVKWAPTPFWVIDTAYYAELNPKEVHPRWFYYVAKYVGLDHLKTGEKPGLSRDMFGRQLYPFPDYPEQEAIANVLGALDDMIELNVRMNDTLMSLARATFKAWFVDFDPVAARADGRVAASTDQAAARLYPSAMKDSRIGPIPAGWSVDEFYRVADVVYGAPFGSRHFNSDRRGLPLIRIRDLAHQNPSVFTQEDHPKATQIQPGDIVVGMDGEFRAHLWSGPQSLLNQRVCTFRPKAPASRAYILFLAEPLLDEFERSKTGTTVIHLGKSDIDTFRVVIPPDPVLEAFAARVEPLLDGVLRNAMQTKVLTRLRDVLLPPLLSGALRVEDAARVVAAGS